MGVAAGHVAIVAVLATLAVSALAQSNTPLTGPQLAPAVSTPAYQAPGTSGAPSAPANSAATQPGQATQAADADPVPRGTFRDSPPARVGVHARDGLLGDETTALLALQASGEVAGPGLPMLGATASRAYRRYLASFNTAIPSTFSAIIQSKASGGGQSSGGSTSTGTGDSQ